MKFEKMEQKFAQNLFFEMWVATIDMYSQSMLCYAIFQTVEAEPIPPGSSNWKKKHDVSCAKHPTDKNELIKEKEKGRWPEIKIRADYMRPTETRKSN